MNCHEDVIAQVIHLKMLFHLKALAPFEVFDTRQTITQVHVGYFPQFLPSVPNCFCPNHWLYCSCVVCARRKQNSLIFV